MPTSARRTIAVAVAAVAIIAAAVALDLPSAAAEGPPLTDDQLCSLAASDYEQDGRIVARRSADGRTEFGWHHTGSNRVSPGCGRVLPVARYFPADARVGRWLRSSPVELAGEAIGRINARRLADGRIEFAFTPTDGERILPPSRYFPADARVGRWLRSSEITIRRLNPFTAVSAGGYHACAIRESGDIECWGRNYKLHWNEEAVQYEQLYGGQTDPLYPYAYTVVSAGSTHTCGLLGGVISCWGASYYGETDAPVGGDFSAVSAGSDQTCAIRESGAIECWGRTLSATPTGRFSAVSAGAGNACAIRESGAIECWGDNTRGQLNGIPAGSDFRAVSIAVWHGCAISESGEIECWGYNYDGANTPPTGRFSAVSAGWDHTCAIRESGEIECWGESNHDGENDAPAGRFSAVSAGTNYTCAIRAGSGEIECWGSNSDGQLDAPTP